MNILIVLGHPDPNSFNHALATGVRDALRSDRHEVVFHDLCAENFSPLLPTGEIPESAPLPASIRRHCFSGNTGWSPNACGRCTPSRTEPPRWCSWRPCGTGGPG